jgi:hypothetical protein
MKIKCSFIYETSEYDSFADLKMEEPKISRKAIERNFIKEIEYMLNLYMEETDSVGEIKAKIIERKDNE